MNRPEERLQRSVADFLRVSLAPPWMFWATPNQKGTRSAAEMGALKAMGVRPGIPDLFVAGPFPADEGQAALIGLELKAPAKPRRDGKPSQAKPALSEAQTDTIAALARCGIPTHIVRSIDDAERVLRDLGVPLRGRAL